MTANGAKHLHRTTVVHTCKENQNILYRTQETWWERDRIGPGEFFLDALSTYSLKGSHYFHTIPCPLTVVHGPCIFGQFNFQIFFKFWKSKTRTHLLAFRRFERIEYWKNGCFAWVQTLLGSKNKIMQYAFRFNNFFKIWFWNSIFQFLF